MKPFRWGIIGPGRIAQKFADCLHTLPNTSLYAIASRSSANLGKLASSMRAEKYYGDYESLAADPFVDAIYIATPHRFHYENALLCLTHHKPVIIEKAFTVNAGEAQALADAARTNGVFLMEAMWTRFLPAYRQVRRWLDAGRIGDVRYLNSSLGFVAKRDVADRLLNPDLAGGTVLDLGVYAMAVSQFVFPWAPKAINAQGFVGETGVDEAISVNLDYGGGAFSQFACTFLARPSMRAEIYGSKGSIVIHANYNASERVVLSVKSSEKEILLPHSINGFEYQIEEAQRCIRAGLSESPLMPVADSVAMLRVLDEVRRQIGVSYAFEKKIACFLGRLFNIF